MASWKLTLLEAEGAGRDSAEKMVRSTGLFLWMTLSRLAALAAVWCILVEPAVASLILDVDAPFRADEVSTPAVVLTIHGHPSGTASGCVSWNGLFDVTGPEACEGTGAPGGDELTGAGQTLTVSFLEIGADSPGSLRVLFQPNEPRRSDLALNNLVLRVFSPEGDILFTSGPFLTAMVVTETHPFRQLGFLFRLPDQDLAPAADAIFSNPNNRIGLAATISGASGGPERFSVFAVNTDPPEPVPEPATLPLAGTAVLVLMLRNRRWRRERLARKMDQVRLTPFRSIRKVWLCWTASPYGSSRCRLWPSKASGRSWPPKRWRRCCARARRSSG